MKKFVIIAIGDMQGDFHPFQQLLGCINAPSLDEAQHALGWSKANSQLWPAELAAQLTEWARLLKQSRICIRLEEVLEIPSLTDLVKKVSKETLQEAATLADHALASA